MIAKQRHGRHRGGETRQRHGVIGVAPGRHARPGQCEIAAPGKEPIDQRRNPLAPLVPRRCLDARSQHRRLERAGRRQRRQPHGALGLVAAIGERERGKRCSGSLRQQRRGVHYPLRGEPSRRTFSVGLRRGQPPAAAAQRCGDATGRRLSLYDEIEDDLPPVLAGDGKRTDERTAFWGAPRAPMTLAVSADGGRTWSKRNVETGDGLCMTNNSRDQTNRELSYPSVKETADGAIHMAFTFHRRAIKYVRVTEPWVKRAIRD